MPIFDFYRDLNRLAERYAGVYLANRFFIRIITDRAHADVEGYDNIERTLTRAAQLDLQAENFVTLFHEYIHYVHEISTIAGIAQFHFEMINRKIFTSCLNLPKTSAPGEIPAILKPFLTKTNTAIQAIRGGSASDMDGQIVLGIKEIVVNPCPTYSLFGGPTTIGVPVIFYNYGDQQSSAKEGWVFFGKYYLYEGLAYHLDNQVAIQRGKRLVQPHHIPPEYKLMSLVAQHICPGIGERSMLDLASLSLSYADCGHRFIRYLEAANTAPDLPSFIATAHEDVNAHLRVNEPKILALLEKIRKQFTTSTQLSAAVGHLCDEMAKGYHQRIHYPTFEVAITMDGHPEDMPQYVVACDMVYEFKDDDEYLRDFAGTYLVDKILPSDLKTFLCHMDYYQHAINKTPEHCCPLFTFCPHELRRKKPAQCRTQPRLAFEDHEIYGWCNYSKGVGYMTGVDEILTAQEDQLP
ncbi:MAG: hypothetical protein V4592_08465 [Bacteroidota bacterium]